MNSRENVEVIITFLQVVILFDNIKQQLWPIDECVKPLERSLFVEPRWMTCREPCLRGCRKEAAGKTNSILLELEVGDRNLIALRVLRSIPPAYDVTLTNSALTEAKKEADHWTIVLGGAFKNVRIIFVHKIMPLVILLDNCVNSISSSKTNLYDPNL